MTAHTSRSPRLVESLILSTILVIVTAMLGSAKDLGGLLAPFAEILLLPGILIVIQFTQSRTLPESYVLLIVSALCVPFYSAIFYFILWLRERFRQSKKLIEPG
jgi:hypothetical protein